MRVSLRPLDQLSTADRAAWSVLYARQTGPANPFCSPTWVLAWYEHFTVAKQQMLVLVHDESESLVGVAPFFRSVVGRGPLRLGNRVQLVGAGQGSSLLELPQVLIAPGSERIVLRAVTAAFRDDPALGGDFWVELCVAPEQGWFEPHWVDDHVQPTAFWRQQMTRACVILPLADSWAETRSGLKRNVKESMRRARNRMQRAGRNQVVHYRTDDLDATVVDRFFDLHSQRAAQEDGPVHGDAFADPRRRDFLRRLLPELGRLGEASIVELELDSQIVGAQLLLHAPSTTYVHSSGFRPAEWHLSPITYLQEDAFAAACERGDSWVNLSPGPNLAKLRWSEHMAVWSDFGFGFGRVSLRRRYSLFAAGQSLKQIQHSARMAGQPMRKPDPQTSLTSSAHGRPTTGVSGPDSAQHSTETTQAR